MIVLDTNVVSEAMRREPNPAARDWLNAQVAETLYFSSVTLAEILFGVAALPNGRRKDALARAFEGLLELFKGRVLPFDADAARYYAELAVRRDAPGGAFPCRMAISRQWPRCAGFWWPRVIPVPTRRVDYASSICGGIGKSRRRARADMASSWAGPH